MNRPKTLWWQKGFDEKNKVLSMQKKATLLLHACCAPCACFPMEWLNEAFEITLYYNNSNIYPESEYNKRKDELAHYVETFNNEHQADIKFLCPPYDNIAYTKKLEPFKDEPECGKRCLLCYTLRMDEAYAYANENHFDYFTTVMTISRQKSSEALNEIGQHLATKYPNTKYFFSDFKKKKGMDRSIELSRQYGLYKQNYCGCIYSYNQRKKDSVHD